MFKTQFISHCVFPCRIIFHIFPTWIYPEATLSIEANLIDHFKIYIQTQRN